MPPVIPPTVTEEHGPIALITVFDPAISKIGFLLPGQIGLQNEQIEWFFTVTNIGNATGVNIVVSDTLRPELRVDSLNVLPPMVGAINGQTITVTIPSLAAGESVNFSVVTTVIQGGEEIDNTACLTADNLSGQRCVTASAIRTLPRTGESPWWWQWLLITVVASTVLAIAFIGYVWRKHLQKLNR